MLLADKGVQLAGAHPGRQRGVLHALLFKLLLKHIHTHIAPSQYRFSRSTG
jgi:hypothetical protein